MRRKRCQVVQMYDCIMASSSASKPGTVRSPYFTSRSSSRTPSRQVSSSGGSWYLMCIASSGVRLSIEFLSQRSMICLRFAPVTLLTSFLATLSKTWSELFGDLLIERMNFRYRSISCFLDAVFQLSVLWNIYGLHKLDHT